MLHFFRNSLTLDLFGTDKMLAYGCQKVIEKRDKMQRLNATVECGSNYDMSVCSEKNDNASGASNLLLRKSVAGKSSSQRSNVSHTSSKASSIGSVKPSADASNSKMQRLNASVQCSSNSDMSVCSERNDNASGASNLSLRKSVAGNSSSQRSSVSHTSSKASSTGNAKRGTESTDSSVHRSKMQRIQNSTKNGNKENQRHNIFASTADQSSLSIEFSSNVFSPISSVEDFSNEDKMGATNESSPAPLLSPDTEAALTRIAELEFI